MKETFLNFVYKLRTKTWGDAGFQCPFLVPKLHNKFAIIPAQKKTADMSATIFQTHSENLSRWLSEFMDVLRSILWDVFIHQL